MQDIITTLLDIQNDQNDSDASKIAHSILLHISEVPELTIYQLADICSTSPTTLSRFVRNVMGKGGYNAFKMKVFEVLINYNSINRLTNATGPEGTAQFIDSYTKKLIKVLRSFQSMIPSETLDAFTDNLYKAESVFIVSSDIGDVRAFQYDMVLYGKNNLFLQKPTTTEQAISSIDAKTFVIFLITSDRAHRMSQLSIKAVQEKGAPVGIVKPTSFHLLSPEPTVVLSYESTGTEMDNELVRYFLHILTSRFRNVYSDNNTGSVGTSEYSSFMNLRLS